jgi:hypothetical protein
VIDLPAIQFAIPDARVIADVDAVPRRTQLLAKKRHRTGSREQIKWSTLSWAKLGLKFPDSVSDA